MDEERAADERAEHQLDCADEKIRRREQVSAEAELDQLAFEIGCRLKDIAKKYDSLEFSDIADIFVEAVREL